MLSLGSQSVGTAEAVESLSRLNLYSASLVFLVLEREPIFAGREESFKLDLLACLRAG